MNTSKSHMGLLIELKELTPRERRFALRLARSSKLAASRYIRVVLENKRRDKPHRGTTSRLKSTIKEGDLRAIIRRAILEEEIIRTDQEIYIKNNRPYVAEQVVGYTPPNDKDSGDDGDGYLSVGDMGVDTSLSGDSSDEEQASADQVKKLTQSRQQDLSQGNTVDAENDAQQLSMARKIRG